MKAVSFRAKDCDRVMVAVQAIGDMVVVEGTFETDDPFVAAALDAHPFVERGKAAKPEAKAEKIEAPAEPEAASDETPEGEN